MTSFYTVTQSNWIVGEIVDFIPPQKWHKVKSNSMYSEEDVLNETRDLYPNGLSMHGLQYLLEHRGYLNYDNRAWVHYETIIENNFELILQWLFPNMPSRFESIFGCLNIKDALKFKTEYRPSNCNICKVEVNDFLVADMNYLGVGFVFGGTLNIAKKYWNGERTVDPFMEVVMKLPVKVLEVM